MKTKMKQGLTLWLFFIGANVNAQTPLAKINLKQAVETGIASNLAVQQRGFDRQQAELNWKQSRLNQLPSLNGNAVTGISQGRSIDPFTNSYSNQQISYASYGLNTSVTLFNGFSLRNTVKQNELLYQASTLDWQQTKDNLTLDIILSYLDILSNGELLQQLQGQSALTKKQIERLEILDKNGAIASYLVSEMRGQLANDQLGILNTENSLESAKVRLSQLMNIPYNKAMQVEKLEMSDYPERYVASADAIYLLALEKFPQVKAEELRRQSAIKAVSVAKADLFPLLSLNGSANTNYSNAAYNEVFLNTTEVASNDFVLVGGNKLPVVYSRDNFSSQRISYGKQLNNNLATGINLSLRIPIFNSHQARNRVKLARINLKNAEWTANTAKTNLQQFIEQAYINMNTAWERYKVLLQQVAAYTEVFQAAEVRYNTGVGNSIDYLLAKNNMDRATSALVGVKYEYLLRIKLLDYYQGVLSL